VVEDVIVVDRVIAAQLSYRALLETLQQLHQLRDGSFIKGAWLFVPHIGDERLRLVATRDGRYAGFLGGLPTQGHIAIVGTVEPSNGTGSSLLAAFADHALDAGASKLTVEVFPVKSTC
jgi:hypothetical protein